MRFIRLFLLVWFPMLFCGSPAVAAPAPLQPPRVGDGQIAVDGRLDEAAWRTALTVENFKTFAPDYGREPAEATTAFAAFDSRKLYFAFRCRDREPGKIKTAVTRRDNIRADDWVCINLDSFNDQQSLYAFYVNPRGIQMDSRFSAGKEDFSSDFLWESAGQTGPDGYTVEIAIPLQSIRYTNTDPVTMSIFFERYISRHAEHDSFPELDPAKADAFLTQMVPLVYPGLKPSRLFEVLPAFTYSQQYEDRDGRLERYRRQGEFGVTAKYGFTPDLILDGTCNPDFSQIESDAGQVDINLRYALYYPEKRPFFLEGSEIFNIAATQSTELDPVVALLHTRNIVDPVTGVKLSGKLSRRGTFAALYAADQYPGNASGLPDEYAHFPVLRYKQALNQDSYIGGIYAGRFTGSGHNQVLGTDGQLRIGESSLLEFNTLFSQTRTPAGTGRNGHSAGFRYGRSTRDLDLSAGFKEVSEDFQLETGYLTRTGIMTWSGLFRPKFYPRAETFRRIDTELFSAQTRDVPGGRWETFNHISAQVFFPGNLNAKVKYSYSTEIFAGREFKTGGFHAAGSGQLTRQFSISLLYRRVQAIYYGETPFPGRSNKVTASLVYQPLETIESSLSYIYSDFTPAGGSRRLYEYPIWRGRLTYQPNKYLFFRGILEYNKFRRQLLTDLLASYTYVPGTGVHFGYGSLFQKMPGEDRPLEQDRYQEMKRGFFLKVSYLWRM